MTAALLVIDVQNDVVAGVDSAAVTVATIAGLVDGARAAGCPVVWVQHDDWVGLPVGSRGWRIVDDLLPAPDDIMVRKQYRSAFADTMLSEALRARGVDQVVLTGAQSAFCVDMAGKHALAEGFDVVLVSAGHCNGAMSTDAGELTDAQVQAVINRTWSSLRHPGAHAQVLPAAAIGW